MTAQLETSEIFHVIDDVRFEADEPLHLNASNINEYAGSLVLAIPYKDGHPTQISGPAPRQNKLEICADDTDTKFYVPTMVGRLGCKHSDTHFTVVPLSHDKGNKAQPPRLFAFGEALVRAASKQA